MKSELLKSASAIIDHHVPIIHPLMKCISHIGSCDRQIGNAVPGHFLNCRFLLRFSFSVREITERNQEGITKKVMFTVAATRLVNTAKFPLGSLCTCDIVSLLWACCSFFGRHSSSESLFSFSPPFGCDQFCSTFSHLSYFFVFFFHFSSFVFFISPCMWHFFQLSVTSCLFQSAFILVRVTFHVSLRLRHTYMHTSGGIRGYVLYGVLVLSFPICLFRWSDILCSTLLLLNISLFPHSFFFSHLLLFPPLDLRLLG